MNKAKYIYSVIGTQEKILNGELIAFPTETVYGLGGNAFDPDAVKSIFSVKGRPPNDPLIVHVQSSQKARELLVLNEHQESIFNILSEKYWPGPLTIIAPAIDDIPSEVSSGSGWVGVRVPSHPVAQMFLRECNLPIAAPSANRFSHVSPTKPEHVMNDLKDHPIYILKNSHLKCDFGVESTIIKLEVEGDPLILRRGAISQFDLNQIIKLTRFEDKKTQFMAPGMMLKHYSPDGIDTIIADCDIPAEYLKNAGILDFGGLLKKYQNKVKWYFDLSKENNSFSACQLLYEKLREAEEKQIERLFLPKIKMCDLNSSNIQDTLADKFYRAASGKLITHTL